MDAGGCLETSPPFTDLVDGSVGASVAASGVVVLLSDTGLGVVEGCGAVLFGVMDG